MLFVYWFLWPLRLVWLLVCCLYTEVYWQIFKFVSFWLHGCCGEWEGGPVNEVNHTSWMAVVTPTDRPKSVRNRCLIELFCGVVCVVTLPFWHFCWCRGFCHRTWSNLLFFVSKTHKVINIVASRKAYECTRQILWLWLHVKSEGLLKADRHVFNSGHKPKLFRLICVVQMECFHFSSGNIRSVQIM